MAKNNANANANANAGEEKEEKLSKDITLVKFLRPHTPYIKGEVAGFNKKFAEKLIEAEIAEEFEK